jgi:hypothetical protein
VYIYRQEEIKVTELRIKILLAEYFLQLQDILAIGAEVSFQYGERRADFISIQSDLLSGYEIKTAGDSISRLKYQLDGYKAFFDFSFVVCEESNLSAVRKIASKDFGILLATSSGIRQIRKSKQFKNHSKEMLASYLSVCKLKQLARNNTLRSKHDLCSFVAIKYGRNELYLINRAEIKSRYKKTYHQMKSEVRTKITSDDILTITRRPPTSLIKFS